MSEFAPTVTYDFKDTEFLGATFERTCPKCGRFVKAGTAHAKMEYREGDWLGIPVMKADGTCKKCGAIEMPFIGFFGGEDG